MVEAMWGLGREALGLGFGGGWLAGSGWEEMGSGCARSKHNRRTSSQDSTQIEKIYQNPNRFLNKLTITWPVAVRFQSLCRTEGKNM